ncbi:MAG: cytochrome C oxidase subunit IV family protein [Ilumatobacteraceae bacterium]
MTTVVEHAAHDSHGHESHDEHAGHSNKHYYLVALALAILTGLEVMLRYVDVGAAFLPLLLILMGIKFVMVVLEFMHLRKDAKIFHYLFWSGFVLAIGVYVAALACFKFFLNP